MRFPAFALVAAFALAAVGARTDMALAYHGKLVRVDAQPIRTRIPMQMEFRLCASETPDGSAPLWGRRTNVRFEDGGLFYVELRDSAGTEIDGAKYTSLSEAAAAAGTNIWISVTPVGYGELLPRKRLGTIHRAEHVGYAAAAGRLVAPKLQLDAAEVTELVVNGTLSVTNSFTAGGGQVENTVTSDDVTLGQASGTVIFSGTFNNWATPSYNYDDAGHVSVDSLLAYPAYSSLGAFSIPLPRGSSTGSLPKTSIIKINTFIHGQNVSPFK